MIPTFNLRLSKIVFDGEQFGKQLGTAINRAMREAAKAFLLECVTRIPVRTGFLRGAFGNLEDIVGTISKTTTTRLDPEKGRVKETRYRFGRGRNKEQLRIKRELRIEKQAERANELLSRIEARRSKNKKDEKDEEEPGAFLKSKSSTPKQYNGHFRPVSNRDASEFNAARAIKEEIDTLRTQVKSMPVGKERDTVVKYIRSRRRAYWSAVGSALAEYNRNNILGKREAAELRHILKMQKKLQLDRRKRILKGRTAKQKQNLAADYALRREFEQLRQQIRAGKESGFGVNLPETTLREYYYPTAVGRQGLKRGVRRGNPILKTPSAGRQFATPASQIFTNNDLGGAKISDSGSILAAQFEAMTGRKMDLGGKGPVKGTFFGFKYGVDIRYYGPNDALYGWLSLRNAAEAFRRVLAEEVQAITSGRKGTKRLKIQEYMRTDTVIVSPGARSYSSGSGRLITYVQDLTPESSTEKFVR